MQHHILNGVLLYVKDVNLESIHLKINKINIIYYYSIKITINNIVLTVPSLIFVISDSSNSSSSSVNSSFSSEIYDEISLVFEQSLSVSVSFIIFFITIFVIKTWLIVIIIITF